MLHKKITIRGRGQFMLTLGVLLASFFLSLGVTMFPTISRLVAASQETTVTFTTSTHGMIANQDGTTRSTTNPWFGTGKSSSTSFLGLYLGGATLPKDVVISRAVLELWPATTQWIPVAATIYTEPTLTPLRYTSDTPRLSNRTRSTKNVAIKDNVEWKQGSKHSYDITALIADQTRLGEIQTLSLLIQGKGAAYGRKFISSNSAPGQEPRVMVTFTAVAPSTATPSPTVLPTHSPTATPRPTATPSSSTNPTATPYQQPTTPIQPSATPPAGGPPASTTPMTHAVDESMSMMAWRVGGKNAPNPLYDKCDDGTDVVTAHNRYYVIAYDGKKYPTWHPPVVTNPVTSSGKCYFGHEHGSNPQAYQYWSEIYEHFGKDTNGDGVLTPLAITPDGRMIAGDRAGLPFGIANEKMDQYYNQEGRDSIFVRHEDHVGHKVEFVNGEADMVGNSTHVMGNNTTGGVHIPYYEGSNSNVYKPTGVMCTHFHKYHQGTHSGDAIRNNMHEVIFHSTCTSSRSEYPGNTVLLTGMMTFGNPSEYKRFCGNDRSTVVCADGKNANGSCIVTDPLISKLPNSVYSDTLGRNMTDKYCLQNVEAITGSKYFTPYEIWQGDLRITKPDGTMLAEHGRQWDVLDPIRYVDVSSSATMGYNSLQCGPGGLLYNRTLLCGALESNNQPWDSPNSGFRGLKRTTYFGRNRVSNNRGAQTYWTDPLGGNATTSQFVSGLKQKFSSVEADICKLPECSRLNDRAIQRQFNDGSGTVHAPN